VFAALQVADGLNFSAGANLRLIGNHSNSNQRYGVSLGVGVTQTVLIGNSYLGNGTADRNVARADLDLDLVGGAKATSPQSIYASTSNFGLTTSSATKLSQTITVPAGFTSAIVSVTGRVYAINNTASVDYLFANAQIDTFVGNGMPIVATASNGSALNVAPFAKVLTGLTPGDTFTILVNAATSFADWISQASNQADMNGTVSWYR